MRCHIKLMLLEVGDFFCRPGDTTGRPITRTNIVPSQDKNFSTSTLRPPQTTSTKTAQNHMSQLSRLAGLRVRLAAEHRDPPRTSLVCGMKSNVTENEVQRAVGLGLGLSNGPSQGQRDVSSPSLHRGKFPPQVKRDRRGRLRRGVPRGTTPFADTARRLRRDHFDFRP